MDLVKIASRVSGATPNMVKVHVTESPNTVLVEYNGQNHFGVWPDDVDEGDWEDVDGDIKLLTAVMMAWQGEPNFEMTADELAELSGGYWSP